MSIEDGLGTIFTIMLIFGILKGCDSNDASEITKSTSTVSGIIEAVTNVKDRALKTINNRGVNTREHYFHGLDGELLITITNNNGSYILYKHEDPVFRTDVPEMILNYEYKKDYPDRWYCEYNFKLPEIIKERLLGT